MKNTNESLIDDFISSLPKEILLSSFSQTAGNFNLNHSALKNLENKLSFDFTDYNMVLNALGHRSFVHEFNKYISLENYEKLEFFGDAILDLIITEKLFELHHDLSEGDLSKLRSSLVNETILAELAMFIGLQNCILIGKGEFKNKGHLKRSILSDSFEALIATIYKQTNYQKTREVVLNLFEKYQQEFGMNLFAKSNLEDLDAKTKLQNLCMQKFGELPDYRFTEEGQSFNVALYINNKFIDSESGISKKECIKILAQRNLTNNLKLLQ